VSCNNIQESNAETLMDSLSENKNITMIDVRSNEFATETVSQINEIVTKNYLK